MNYNKGNSLQKITMMKNLHPSQLIKTIYVQKHLIVHLKTPSKNDVKKVKENKSARSEWVKTTAMKQNMDLQSLKKQKTIRSMIRCIKKPGSYTCCRIYISKPE
jgi:hypothetical protein